MNTSYSYIQDLTEVSMDALRLPQINYLLDAVPKDRYIYFRCLAPLERRLKFLNASNDLTLDLIVCGYKQIITEHVSNSEKLNGIKLLVSRREILHVAYEFATIFKNKGTITNGKT